MVGSAVYQGANRMGAHDAALCSAFGDYLYLGKIYPFSNGRDYVANISGIDERVSK